MIHHENCLSKQQICMYTSPQTECKAVHRINSMSNLERKLILNLCLYVETFVAPYREISFGFAHCIHTSDFELGNFLHYLSHHIRKILYARLSRYTRNGFHYLICILIYLFIKCFCYIMRICYLFAYYINNIHYYIIT